MVVRLSPFAAYVAALGFATVVAAGLLVADSLANGSVAHGYLLWNVALAWIPFGLSLWLRRVITRKLWSSWEALLTTILWLIFLPNTFYLISDYVHLPEGDASDTLFQVTLFTSFIFIGVVLGLSGVYIVHRQLLKRLPGNWTALVVAAVLLACSFAVYVGRDLRWNSWDVLINPAGVLFDISARAAHPAQYGAAVAFVAPFFMLLAGIYAVTWAAARVIGAAVDR